MPKPWNSWTSPPGRPPTRRCCGSLPRCWDAAPAGGELENEGVDSSFRAHLRTRNDDSSLTIHHLLMKIHPLHSWDIDPTQAAALQKELAGRVDVRTPLT